VEWKANSPHASMIDYTTVTLEFWLLQTKFHNHVSSSIPCPLSHFLVLPTFLVSNLYQCGCEYLCPTVQLFTSSWLHLFDFCHHIIKSLISFASLSPASLSSPFLFLRYLIIVSHNKKCESLIRCCHMFRKLSTLQGFPSMSNTHTPLFHGSNKIASPNPFL